MKIKSIQYVQFQSQMGLVEMEIGLRVMIFVMTTTTMVDVIGMEGIAVVTMLEKLFALNVSVWTHNFLVLCC